MFWTPYSKICKTLAAVSCAAGLVACTENNIPSGAHYIISVPRADFYKFGPAQQGGPDFVLNEGTKIIMLEHSFGYSRVMTADGTAGYVSTEDVRPAPPGPFTTSRNAETNYTVQLNRPMFDQPKRSNVPGNNGPLFDQNDNPLPQNSDSQKPAPNFHF
jgi:hypothetical protein